MPTDELPLFQDDLDFVGLGTAIQRSIDFYNRCGRIFEVSGRKLSGAEMADSLRLFRELIAHRPSAAGLNRLIRDNFDVYASTANEADGVLFTGYYEPLIECSRTRSEKYGVPLYKMPPDMITVDLGLFRQGLAGERLAARLDGKKLVPYYSRKQIDGEGCLAGRCQALYWAADPIDVFFLQIQGSGCVRLEDGTQTRVHYAGSNGRAFRSIGRLLIEQGCLPREGVSMQVLRRYLKEHPDQMQAVFNYNESYVFFEEVTEGPLGNIGVVLSPGRSIATDWRLFPGGGLAWVKARKPVIEDGRIIRWERFSRFVMSQDTGGAICGPGRVDFFWGTGPDAELPAGGMCERGKLYFLVKKRLAPAAARVDRDDNGGVGAKHHSH
jgi:membrane-bound lytic murein transglycosylase A